MFELCPRCDGAGDVVRSDDFVDRCQSCSGCGRVVSESVIEEMAEALCKARDAGLEPSHPDRRVCSYSRFLAKSVGRVVLEHMEDKG